MTKARRRNRRANAAACQRLRRRAWRRENRATRRQQHRQRRAAQARQQRLHTAPLYRRALARIVESSVGRRLHAKQALSVFMIAYGIVWADRLGVAAVGTAMARRAFGTSPKHGIKQVDRCLSDTKIKLSTLFAGYVPFVVGQRQSIIVTFDWTEFDKDDHTVICVSLVTGTKRALPLVWRTVQKSRLKGRQRSHERKVLSMLAEALPVGVKVIVLADRGFGDVNLYRYITSLGFDFVIRYRPNIKVRYAGALCASLDWVPRNGRVRVLRDAYLTAKNAGPWTVVLTKARDMKEPWCLATSLAELDGRHIVQLYGKRFQCEEGFRDLKDRRYGYGLRFAKIRRCDRRDRMLFLFCLAYLVLTLMGGVSEKLGLDKSLRANTVTARTHSLFRQGYALLGELATEAHHSLASAFQATLNSLLARGLHDVCS